MAPSQVPDSTPPGAGFGPELRRLREHAELTQEQLAERAGLSARTISDLERGSPHRPRRDTLRLLGAALGLGDVARQSFITLARQPAAAPAQAGVGAAGGPEPLFGRDEELATIVARLRSPEGRLLTLTGVAGIGKSHLARAVVARAAPWFPAGVWSVDLAAGATPTRLLSALVAELGIAREAGEPRLTAITRHLANHVVLLMVDHADAAAPEIQRLRGVLPHCRLLVTCRRPLGLADEQVMVVRPLPVLGVGFDEAIAANGAEALFMAQARRVEPTLEVDEATGPVVREIVAALDGHPGAIVAAAAQLGVTSLTALHRDLAGPAPGVGQVDDPESAAGTLASVMLPAQAAIRDAYDQLDIAERYLFRQLAVFAGPFSRVAALAVSGMASGGVFVGEAALRTLVTAGLVQAGPPRATSATGDRPLWLTGAARAVARQLLATAGERADAGDRHAVWVDADLDQRGLEPIGPDQEAWYAHLAAMASEWRAALRWSLDTNQVTIAARLVRALYRFWATSGEVAEGSAWLGAVLAASHALDAPALADVHLGAGVMAFYRGDYEGATRFWRLASRQEPAGSEASTRSAYALANRGLIDWHVTGNQELAVRRFASARGRFLTLAEPIAAIYMVRNLGMVGCFERDFAFAEQSFQESLLQSGTAGDAAGVAMSLGDLGLLRLREGQPAAAAALVAEALAIGRDQRNVPWLLRMIEIRGLAAATASQPAIAARLLGAAARARHGLGTPALPRDAAQTAHALAAVRGELGSAAFGRAWWAGSQESLTEARELAMTR